MLADVDAKKQVETYYKVNGVGSRIVIYSFLADFCAFSCKTFGRIYAHISSEIFALKSVEKNDSTVRTRFSQSLVAFWVDKIEPS